MVNKKRDLSDLSSEVDTNLLFWSTNVIVFTAPWLLPFIIISLLNYQISINNFY